VGGTLFLVVILSAVLAPWLSPYAPFKANLRSPLDPPGAAHVMGTDRFGRDVFSRVLWGGRLSLTVGVVSVGIAAACGVTLGLVAGYTGRGTEAVIMRTMDLLQAFPGILLALAILTKPQGVLAMPPVALALWRMGGGRALGRAAAAGLTTLGFDGGTLRVLRDLGFHTTFWSRSSASGRFVAAGGVKIIDLQQNVEIPVEASYDPGFFPDDSGFLFQGTSVGAGICNFSLLSRSPSQITFREPECTGGSLGLYQYIGAALGGGDYFAVTSQFDSDNGGHGATLHDPAATFGGDATAKFTPTIPSDSLIAASCLSVRLRGVADRAWALECVATSGASVIAATSQKPRSLRCERSISTRRSLQVRMSSQPSLVRPGPVSGDCGKEKGTPWPKRFERLHTGPSDRTPAR